MAHRTSAFRRTNDREHLGIKNDPVVWMIQDILLYLLEFEVGKVKESVTKAQKPQIITEDI